jgi:hypothetical protein
MDTMSTTRNRWLLVIAAWVSTTLWVWAIFAPYDPINDPWGLNGLFLAIAASGLHIIAGALSLIASAFGVVRRRFGYLMLATPFLHALGSPIEAPWCFLPFLAPSILIILAGAFEVVYPMARVAPSIVNLEP